MEFLLIIPILSTLFALIVTGIIAIKPYVNGTKKLDPIQYPILARAQRIHRYSNVKAREIEASARLKELTAKKNDIILESGNASARAVAEVAAKHQKEMRQWLTDFKAITAAEDARKATIAKQIERDNEARRLAVWQAEEKIRIAAFIEEQRLIQGEERRRAEELMRSREKDAESLRKYYVPNRENQSFGYRVVNVHGLYVRKLPVKASRMVDNLTTGAMVSVNGWIQGEEVYGNPIWFKLANDAGWIWSGGVDNKSTSGLINYNYMNKPGDSIVTKSANGMIVQQYTAPSEMKDLIDQEIAAIEREKDALSLTMNGGAANATNYYQPTMPTGSIAAGSMWFDTKHSNKAYSWDGHVWLPTFSANMVTGDGPDQVTIRPNLFSVTRNGQTITSLKGGLTAPRETQYDIGVSEVDTYRSVRKDWFDEYKDRYPTKTNFWRGTEFEHLGR